MDLDKIKLLIDAMATSGLGEMEFSENGWTLRLVRQSPQPLVQAGTAGQKPILIDAEVAHRPETPQKAQAGSVVAPLPGIVYLHPSPEAAPFITAGQNVRAGALLCLIEAMKTFNEVRAERDGAVDAILVASGEEVEAGQPLLRVL